MLQQRRRAAARSYLQTHPVGGAVCQCWNVPGGTRRGACCRIGGAAGRCARFPLRRCKFRHQPVGVGPRAWLAGQGRCSQRREHGLLGLWVAGSAFWHAVHGTLPHASVTGVVGVVALFANGGVALLLYRYREGDANMRSVLICSHNDGLGNVAVILAAFGVFLVPAPAGRISSSPPSWPPSPSVARPRSSFRPEAN